MAGQFALQNHSRQRQLTLPLRISVPSERYHEVLKLNEHTATKGTLLSLTGANIIINAHARLEVKIALQLHVRRGW